MLCAMLLALAAAGQQLPTAPSLPPANSPPVVRAIEIAFPKQGNVSVIEPETYLFYIQTRPSRPSANVWVPYDRQSVLDDFHRLWATGFLDDLSIEEKDEPYSNGVIGKHIIFNLEEQPRVKIIDFEGTKVLERSKIDDKLKEENAIIRADTFFDNGVVHRTEKVLLDMLHEKGYQYAAVTHTATPLSGGPKLIHLTFNMDTGPQVRIRSVNFIGNRTFKDGALASQMKSNKAPQWWLPWFARRKGAYQPSKYEEDADYVVQYYRDHGYVTARIGDPAMRTLDDSRDKKTRWVELQIPVTEGRRYRIGEVTVDGNTVVKTNALREMFKLKKGEFYHEKAVRKGFEKAREIYGTGGYFEFTGYPDLKPRDPPEEKTEPGAAPKPRSRKPLGPAILDLTLRMQEGKQYFINRLTFKGNTTTHDSVIRREVALMESGVFNTEALKYSVKRINQLGYFKPLEDQKNIQVDKTPGADNKVDVTLNFEEQNRNQIQFGAGMSEYDGLFGSLSYTAANFLGRGESVTLAVQRGSRSNLYQVGVMEPYLFDRPISVGIDLYSRKYDYLMTTGRVGYSEVREGSSVTIGKPFRRFSRISLGYTFEVIDSSVSNDLLGKSSSSSGSSDSSSTSSSTSSSSSSSSTTTTASSSSNTKGMPWFNSYYDIGRHNDSRITPSFSFNTVDNPMLPHSGMRVTGSVQFASKALNGSYNYTKQEGEAVLYWPTSRRTGFGLRAEGGWLRQYGKLTTLPYYLRYFLGGEYQIRGYDIRTVGPIDSSNRALGGNKFVLFNAEYYIDVVSAVRMVLYHDAGQAFAEGDPVNLRLLRTSSGAEVRILVPMLNVPFRLIWAYNRYRDSFQPEFAFKFGVGATF